MRFGVNVVEIDVLEHLVEAVPHPSVMRYVPDAWLGEGAPLPAIGDTLLLTLHPYPVPHHGWIAMEREYRARFVGGQVVAYERTLAMSRDSLLAACRAVGSIGTPEAARRAASLAIRGSVVDASMYGHQLSLRVFEVHGAPPLPSIGDTISVTAPPVAVAAGVPDQLASRRGDDVVAFLERDPDGATYRAPLGWYSLWRFARDQCVVTGPLARLYAHEAPIRWNGIRLPTHQELWTRLYGERVDILRSAPRERVLRLMREGW